ncbi:MAG: carotenoid biosynthesis protein [Chitinivibrionales bacterium]
MYQHLNEVVSILSNIGCWVHAYFFFGRSLRRSALFMGGAMVLGTISELAAIATTGGYNYDGFWWYIGTVPLFIAIGWGAAFYFPFVFTSMIARHLPRKKLLLLWFGLIAGSIGVSIDLWYDPVAVALGWWSWKNPGPYYAVPTSNFVGWFCFTALFCTLFLFIDTRTWTFRRKTLVFIALLPVVLLITAAVSFPFF